MGVRSAERGGAARGLTTHPTQPSAGWQPDEVIWRLIYTTRPTGELMEAGLRGLILALLAQIFTIHTRGNDRTGVLSACDPTRHGNKVETEG
jgi:hypothetical protein